MEQEHLYPPVDSDRPKVLCIDDDPEVSRALGIRLGNHNVEVLRAFHGMQGFWLALTERPDLIITDLLMTGMDGLQLLNYLHEKNVSVPVIVLSADVQTTSRQRCEDLGVSGFLHKPVKADQLIDAVSNALGQPQGTGA